MTKIIGSAVKKAGRSNTANKRFKLLKAYSNFLLQFHLDALVSDVVNKAKGSKIHILELLNKYSEREIFDLFKGWIAGDVLIPVTEDRPFEQIKKKIKAWKENSSIISRDELLITDIVSFNHVRQRGMISFLQYYQCAEDLKYKLIDEIENYFEICIELGLNAYEEIQKEKNQNEIFNGISDSNIIHGQIIQEQEETQVELNSLIDGVKDYAIFKLKIDGTIASWNEGARALKGYTKEEVLGKHFSIFYPKEKQDERFPQYELEQAKKKGRFEDEGYRIKKDGSQIWANVVITAIFDNNKKLTGFTKITRDLTERKKAEEKLRQSEARLRAMISGVKDYAIFLLNPDGTIASWNEGAKRFKGYNEKDIIGKHFSIFYPKEKQESMFPEYELEQAKRVGRFEDEGIRVRKDGTTFWANVVITAIYDDKKELIGFTKVTRDLTEKKEAEDILKQSEERFRHLVEGVRDYAIYMLNPNGTIATWNEGARSLKGYTRGEILGRHFSIFYPEDKKNEKFPEFELEVVRRTGRLEDEGFRVRKDGTRFWANVIITAIYNDKKELLGFTKITRDLTERRQAEEILRRSEERYRLLVDAVKDYSIFMIDPEGKINSWNEGARRLKGYSEGEVLGKHISIFYPKEKQDERYPDYELEQAKNFGRFEDEGLRLRKNGSTFYANVIITALYDKDKNLIGFSKITRDLTERKQLEESLRNINFELEEKVKKRTEELQRTVNELTKINNDLDNFIYTASHDLKAPVSNIEGLFSGLFEELGVQVERNENISTFRHLIAVSIQRFQNTIKELTEIAKIQKDTKEESELIDLKEVVQDIEFSIRDLVVKNSAKIVTDFKELSQINFVKKNLKSIFYNIISNGIKYRRPERNPVIKVNSFEDGEFQVISFQDNGLGIKPENKERMFTMFKRFHDHVEGSGVGLYIVKRIIENAGGKIEVESKEREGSTFKVYIPKH